MTRRMPFPVLLFLTSDRSGPAAGSDWGYAGAISSVPAPVTNKSDCRDNSDHQKKQCENAMDGEKPVPPGNTSIRHTCAHPAYVPHNPVFHRNDLKSDGSLRSRFRPKFAWSHRAFPLGGHRVPSLAGGLFRDIPEPNSGFHPESEKTNSNRLGVARPTDARDRDPARSS